MSPVDIAAIKNFVLGFNLVEPPFTNSAKIIPVQQLLTFSHVTALLMKEGTYTPNGDYEWLAQAIPAGEAPNFIFIQSPVAMNLSVRANGQLFLSAAPIDQAFFLLLPLGSTAVITDIYLEGRPDQAISPMAQGVACPFFFIAAQVTRQ